MSEEGKGSLEERWACALPSSRKPRHFSALLPYISLLKSDLFFIIPITKSLSTVAMEVFFTPLLGMYARLDLVCHHT